MTVINKYYHQSRNSRRKRKGMLLIETETGLARVLVLMNVCTLFGCVVCLFAIMYASTLVSQTAPIDFVLDAKTITRVASRCRFDCSLVLLQDIKTESFDFAASTKNKNAFTTQQEAHIGYVYYMHTMKTTLKWLMLNSVCYNIQELDVEEANRTKLASNVTSVSAPTNTNITTYDDKIGIVVDKLNVLYDTQIIARRTYSNTVGAEEDVEYIDASALWNISKIVSFIFTDTALHDDLALISTSTSSDDIDANTCYGKDSADWYVAYLGHVFRNEYALIADQIIHNLGGRSDGKNAPYVAIQLDIEFYKCVKFGLNIRWLFSSADNVAIKFNTHDHIYGISGIFDRQDSATSDLLHYNMVMRMFFEKKIASTIVDAQIIETDSRFYNRMLGKKSARASSDESRSNTIPIHEVRIAIRSKWDFVPFGDIMKIPMDMRFAIDFLVAVNAEYFYGDSLSMLTLDIAAYRALLGKQSVLTLPRQIALATLGMLDDSETKWFDITAKYETAIYSTLLEYEADILIKHDMCNIIKTPSERTREENKDVTRYKKTLSTEMLDVFNGLLDITNTAFALVNEK
jgi:hypothetical protein